MGPLKYIFEQGIMKISSAFLSHQTTTTGRPSTIKSTALAIISSIADIGHASHAQQMATGYPMQLSSSTMNSMNIIQDPYYLNRFQSPTPLQGGQVLDKLSNIFAYHDVPIGLINKLLALQNYSLNFMIDDSQAMSGPSDADPIHLSPYMQAKRQGRQNYPLTRWEEAEDRLHVMIDMLAYVPTNKITISFLNFPQQKFVLNHIGCSPEQFAANAHRDISNMFNRMPGGPAPIYGALKNSFDYSYGPTMHYLFTAGEPSDATVENVAQLVYNRRNPQDNPLTFLSCTNASADWMKQVDEKALFTAEIDDFNSETREVMHDQGMSFPFTRGFWILCALAAAINPDDLDAMDESTPFTKFTLDSLLGRMTTDMEYQYYWNNHPLARNYYQYYQRFATEPTVARMIVGNPNSGYPNPGMPGNPSYPGSGNPGYPGYPGSGNPSYPGSGNPSYPSYPGTGNPSYPGTGNPSYPSYPGTGNPSYPGTGNPSYPSYPGTGNPSYPGTGNPSYPSYPGTGTPSYPSYPGTGTPSYPSYPGTGNPSYPSNPNYPNNSGYPRYPTNGHSFWRSTEKENREQAEPNHRPAM